MSEVVTQSPSGVAQPMVEQDAVSGELILRFHAGQMRAWNSNARIILVLAGTQSGKTSWGPYWLWREMQLRGPGDYMVVAPTFPLLSKKLFPEFLRLFKTLGRLGDMSGKGGGLGTFRLSAYGCRTLFGRVPTEPTQIFFCHAQDPDSLESATAKGIWLDEAGQKKFRLGSWEALNRRGAINRARILISTTPYVLGWLKDQVYDPWKQAKNRGENHPYIEVVNFKSIDNPAFPKEEYERARATMPLWKFRMSYEGIFDRPAGAVYDCFNTDATEPNCHVIEPMEIPLDWPRYLGLDFGGVHTAGVFFAEELRPLKQEMDQWGNALSESLEQRKTGRLFIYREYPLKGQWQSLPAKGHVYNLLMGEKNDRGLRVPEPAIPKAVGGAASEDQWREEFRIARTTDQEGKLLCPGLNVREPPIKAVDVGIQRVYETIKKGELLVFNTCPATIDDIQNYSYELDDSGDPLPGVIEDKNSYHLVDALRYGISYIKGVKSQLWVK